jgi:hypothetical protein
MPDWPRGHSPSRSFAAISRFIRRNSSSMRLIIVLGVILAALLAAYVALAA